MPDDRPGTRNNEQRNDDGHPSPFALLVLGLGSRRERTERPVGLRPHIERAFEQERVSLDFAGFSGETFQGVVQEPPAL